MRWAADFTLGNYKFLGTAELLDWTFLSSCIPHSGVSRGCRDKGQINGLLEKDRTLCRNKKTGWSILAIPSENINSKLRLTFIGKDCLRALLIIAEHKELSLGYTERNQSVMSDIMGTSTVPQCRKHGLCIYIKNTCRHKMLPLSVLGSKQIVIKIKSRMPDKVVFVFPYRNYFWFCRSSAFYYVDFKGLKVICDYFKNLCIVL